MIYRVTGFGSIAAAIVSRLSEAAAEVRAFRAFPSKCGSVITSRLVTDLDRDVEILDSEAFGQDWQDLLAKQMYPYDSRWTERT
jgi:hypothetical protein